MPHLTDEQRQSWERDGFIRLPGSCGGDTLRAMEACGIEGVRRAEAGQSIPPACLPKEERIAATGTEPTSPIVPFRTRSPR